MDEADYSGPVAERRKRDCLCHSPTFKLEIQRVETTKNMQNVS